MMKATWKGAISCGLMTIPCKLYIATEEKTLHFNQIHSVCGSRIKMPKHCPECQRDVETTEIKKGYEVSKGQYVVLEEEELESLRLKTVKAIEIKEFTTLDKLDPRVVLKSYFLAPEDTGLKGFDILRQAMEALGLCAIAQVVMVSKERLVVVRPFNDILLLQTMFHADELRGCSELSPNMAQATLFSTAQASEKEVELGKTLLNAMIGNGDLAIYHDYYREAVVDLIQRKLSGEEITLEAITTPAEPVDTVAQLIASIEAKKVEA